MKKNIIIGLCIILLMLSMVHARTCVGDRCTNNLLFSLKPLSSYGYPEISYNHGHMDVTFTVTAALDFTNYGEYNGYPGYIAGQYSYYWKDKWVDDLDEFPHKYEPLKLAYCTHGLGGYGGPEPNSWTWRDDSKLPISGYFPTDFIDTMDWENNGGYYEDVKWWWWSERSLNYENMIEREWETGCKEVDGIIRSTNPLEEVMIECMIYLNPYYQEVLIVEGYTPPVTVAEMIGHISPMNFWCKDETELEYPAMGDVCVTKLRALFNITQGRSCTSIWDGEYISPPELEEVYYDIGDIPEGQDSSGTIPDPDDGQGIKSNSTANNLPGKYDIQKQNVEDSLQWEESISRKMDILKTLLNIVKLLFSIYLLMFIAFEFWVIGYFFSKIIISVPHKILEIMKEAGKGL